MLEAMKSYFIHSENWQSQNDQLHAALSLHHGLHPSASVRVFPHYEQAVFELAQGTCFFYAHKRSLSMQLGASPLLSHFQKIFLREGLQVQSLDPQNLHGEALEKWSQEVKKDTNFCLFQADHSFLDQQYATDEFEKKCEEKKIFCLILHHQSLKQKMSMQPEFLKSIRPFSVHVFHADSHPEQDLCVALCGERFKTPTLIIDQLESIPFHRQMKALIDIVPKISAVGAENGQVKEKVQAYEQIYPHPFQAEGPRQFRQIMLGTKKSSDFIYQELVKIKDQWQTMMFSPNLCFQGFIGAQFQWWKPQLDLQLLNHLLIVDAFMVDDASFWTDLAELDAKQTNSSFAVKLE